MHVNATLALPLVSVAAALAPDRGGGGRAINALDRNARLPASLLPVMPVPPPVAMVGSGEISFALFSAAIRAANRDEARLNPESVRD
jgi:hypothetical protein